MKKLTILFPLFTANGFVAACSSSTSSTAANPDGGTSTGLLPDGGPATTGDGGVTGDAGNAPAPDWTPDGTPTTIQNVTFNGPKGWTPTATTTDSVYTAPAMLNGVAVGTTIVDVVAPRPTVGSGEAALRAQAWPLITQAFDGHTITDPSHNATPVDGLLRGTAAQGYTFVGWDLLIDGGSTIEVHAYLAAFGTTAVPFVIRFDPSSGASRSAAELAEAELLQTLTVPGMTPVSVADQFTETYTLSASHILGTYNFPGPNQWIETIVSDFNSVQTTYQYVGAYTLDVNVMSFYPTGGTSVGAPSSNYYRFYQKSDHTVAGGWTTYFCLLTATTDSHGVKSGSEACYSR